MTSVKDRLKPGSTVKIAFDVEDGEKKDNGLENPRYIIGYWSIRGLAAPIRMMLSAAQVNHWVALYDVKESGVAGWSQSQYHDDKSWLKEEYNCLMNLPFLVYHNDEGKECVMVQTNAILTFLGRELDMLGSNKYETTLCEQLLCEIMDLRDQMVKFAYPGAMDPTVASDTKADAVAMMSGPSGRHLDKLEQYLKGVYDGQPDEKVCYLVGGRFSAPDFHLWEMLAQYQGLGRHYNLDDSLAIWHNRPYLKSFYENFKQLPENHAHIESKLMGLPYNNPYARFGSDAISLGQYLRGQGAPWTGWGVVEDCRTKLPASKKQKTT